MLGPSFGSSYCVETFLSETIHKKRNVLRVKIVPDMYIEIPLVFQR